MQNAIAEGDTRTISMHHIHTDEDITITFKRDGRYDDAALEKLNWFLRDWRRGEQTQMDPHLIDLVWEVQRETGAKDPIWVVCGYRSPETNAMLRHRSQGVARFSQHMLGHAMDFYIPGVPLEQLRVIGLRLQRGGVGFYPESGSPFVHMDTAGIRMWPRMTREELARVFPDGRTVHIPTDGRPLPGYALALADIRKRGSSPSENSIEAARNAGVDVGSVVASNGHANFNPFARLFGRPNDEDNEDADADSPATTASAAPAAASQTRPKPTVVAALEHAAAKTVAVARAGVAAAPKLIRMTRAEAAQPPAAAPTAPDQTQTAGRFAALTPNQIITARGYWQGLPDGATAAQPATPSPSKTAQNARRTEVASADPDATGAVSPWRSASVDRVSPELALAYADPAAAHDAPSAAVSLAAAATRAAADSTGELLGQSATTVAVKGVIDQPHTSIQKAIQLATAAVKVGARFDNPWLRAVVLSPSVHRFLTTLALGARDVSSLATLMVKPTSSVMMTFSSDPNPGLSHDHFSGSAIVFLPTVTYPTRTAALQ